ncbi:uncharacterized protein LOC121389440 [Gigantopelta aegis]|uniref:uncharacterized protein LOC121389440 n=1 Tax=Gigantopelta aegis TaxID=1735272 RepID=UPI001B88B635|nr:uncharacterized protein LOC121389440 [Gigantopelta aegis]
MDTKKQQLSTVEIKFRKVKKPGSYIATKLPATPSARQTPKRQRVIHTPSRHTSRRSKTFSPGEKVSTSVKSSQLRQALINISKSKYHTGFRRLFNSSKAAKKAAFQSDQFC